MHSLSLSISHPHTHTYILKKNHARLLHPKLSNSLRPIDTQYIEKPTRENRSIEIALKQMNNLKFLENFINEPII